MNFEIVRDEIDKGERDGRTSDRKISKQHSNTADAHNRQHNNNHENSTYSPIRRMRCMGNNEPEFRRLRTVLSMARHRSFPMTRLFAAAWLLLIWMAQDGAATTDPECAADGRMKQVQVSQFNAKGAQPTNNQNSSNHSNHHHSCSRLRWRCSCGILVLRSSSLGQCALVAFQRHLTRPLTSLPSVCNYFTFRCRRGVSQTFCQPFRWWKWTFPSQVRDSSWYT